jgi:hypothetical protein
MISLYDLFSAVKEFFESIYPNIHLSEEEEDEESFSEM